MTATDRAKHVSDLASFQALLAGLSTGMGPAGELQRERVLASFAPFVLEAGSWLAPLTHVRCAHGELGAACLAALHYLAGGGEARLHHRALYAAALASLGVEMPADEAAHCDDPRPEYLVGMHAAHVVRGVPAIVEEALGGQGALFLERQRGSQAQALLLRMLHVLAAEPRTDWRAVAQGALDHAAALAGWCARQTPEPAPSPRAAMAALVTSKAAHAIGFHGRVSLGKCPMDTMFANAGEAPQALLDALAASPWVAPGAPDESRLVRAAHFGGPMFGVFTGRELEVVRSWIASLPAPAFSEPPARPRRLPTVAPRPAHPDEPADGLGRSAALYHRLLTSPHGEATRRAARNLLDATLRRAQGRCTEARLARRGLWPWSPERFAAWVHDTLRAQAHEAAGAQRSVVRLLSRDDALFVLLQLVPAAFVDGAWLQGLRTPRLSAHPVAGRLLAIYHDELGAGTTRQHHGNVMRRALAAQGIELPACDSRAFAAYPGFRDAAFVLPAFWLALAEHAEEHVPELLGLNLAVEMAGIGGDYARMTCLLRRHGIDSYFFELHNTIDNAASGHTAISVQAIIAHLAQLGSAAGPAAVDAAWRRVRCGFESYAVASRPLAYAMLRTLGPRTALRWLGATVRGQA